MNLNKFSFVASLLLCVIAASFSLSFINAAPVDIYAGDFIDLSGKPLAGYTVTLEETQQQYTLDSTGRLSLDLPVGFNCTFTVHGGKDYRDTQSATATVPAQGFTGRFNEIVLQVPDAATYDLLNLVVPHKRNFSQCQVVVTACNYQKSWYDCPQGFPGVVATLHPPLNEDTFYFGTWGFISNKTNPLPNKLTSSSWDGGVFFINIPMDTVKDFVVTAEYGDAPFSATRIKCLVPGRLINAAPNQGPRAQAPLTNLPCPNTC